MTLARKSRGTKAFEGAGYVNAPGVNPARSRFAAFIDIHAFVVRRSRVSLGTYTRVAAVSVEARSGCSAGLRLTLVNV